MRLVRVAPIAVLVVAVVGGLATVVGSAQDNPAAGQRPGAYVRPARGGFPLPALPAVFETSQQKIRVSVVVRGLDRPWSLLILPDGDMLVSMRNSGEIRAI